MAAQAVAATRVAAVAPAQAARAVGHGPEQTGMPFDDEDVRLITLFIDKTLRDERLEAIRPVGVSSGLTMPIDPPGSC